MKIKKKDSYSRLKKSAQEEEAKLEQSYTQLKLADTNFMKYCRYGLTLLSNLDTYYQEAAPSIQKKLLGSIFTGKLIFEDGNYRTTQLNQAVELIDLFQKELEKNKTKHFDISEKTFGKLREGGLEPPRDFSHYHLKVACLPVPPSPLKNIKLYNQQEKLSTKFSINVFFNPGFTI
jgi:hypothetical protein